MSSFYRASRFSQFAKWTARAAGHPAMFGLAVGIILGWLFAGPFYRFSDTWQLVINTGTTIVTFLMVFLIQNSQNRDSAAIQVKLDELIRVGAVQNRFVGIEHLTEEEIDELRRKCEARAQQKGGSEAVRRIAASRPRRPENSGLRRRWRTSRTGNRRRNGRRSSCCSC